jgi:hypothetical protein
MGAIGMNATEMLNSPIRNVGIGGIYYFANCVSRWEEIYGRMDLDRVCREAHDAIEGDGIGGGCFRFLYADFLQYASKVTGSASLAEVSDGYRQVCRVVTDGENVHGGRVRLPIANRDFEQAHTIATKEHELQISS